MANGLRGLVLPRAREAGEVGVLDEEGPAAQGDVLVRVVPSPATQMQGGGKVPKNVSHALYLG